MKPASKLIALALVAAAGCSGSLGTPGSVDMSARVGPAPGTAVRAASGGLVVADGIVLDRARIVVSRLRVEGTGESEISAGPLLVDASGDALAGAVQQLITARVPSGTYRELKVAVHPLDRTPAGAPAGLGDLVAKGASVLLEGTITDGAVQQPFTFVSALDAELQQEGTFTIGATGGSTSNFTIVLDATKWFKDASGARLDPRDATKKAAIEANIRASFGAFEDDDHDGEEDHHDGADGGEHEHDGGDDDRRPHR